MTSPLPECCRTCSCGRVVCRDDHPRGCPDCVVACPMCSVDIDVAALCECDNPTCCRCHRAWHVEKRETA